MDQDPAPALFIAEVGAHSGTVRSTDGEEEAEFRNTDERSSPAGFAWGDEGPGAFALAHSILTHRLGFKPSRLVAMDFAFQVIASADAGQPFSLPSDVVDSFVAATGGVDACRDEWEDDWSTEPDALSIETELVELDSVSMLPAATDTDDRAYVAAGTDTVGDAHVVLVGNMLAHAQGGSTVFALAGSTVDAGGGSVVHARDGAVVTVAGRRYVAGAEGLTEVTERSEQPAGD